MDGFDWSELRDFTEYSKLFIGLIAITDPIGLIPIFLGLTASMSNAGRHTVALTGTLVFLLLAVVFVFAGAQILAVFGITLAAFKVAGGLLLLMDGMSMLRDPVPGTETPGGASEPISIGMVPIAMPLLAGPGAMSTIVVFTGEEPGAAHSAMMLVVVLSVAVAVYVSLRLGSLLSVFMGENARLLMHRIMGLIILAIAVEFILDGIGAHFAELTVTG